MTRNHLLRFFCFMKGDIIMRSVIFFPIYPDQKKAVGSLNPFILINATSKGMSYLIVSFRYFLQNTSFLNIFFGKIAILKALAMLEI